MEDLNGDYFSLLVDESGDVSRKEQMAIVLRYVDKWGSMVERFIGIVHVRDTSALCLKKVIVNYLPQYSLSLSHIRGQCYDGSSNMQERLSGLKTLIQQESRSAHAIHLRCSFKRMDELQKSQAEKVQEALDMGEVETGKGLNQELDLARAANICWGSHYKSFKKFISMFVSITDVLDTIVVDSECEYRAKAPGFLRVCQTFDITFILHLMRDILEITNELNESL
ncbi:uncharacterized protein LOC132612335 [Lycium barbarum]|uniref:uncharacterized protein LOC132612335 n=1 Tax=Lycium barbarum TaxID=112863 RepID=UPI00293F5A96|nr:uncharacterized protein LOC132612335 [Lycium barbarum]